MIFNQFFKPNSDYKNYNASINDRLNTLLLERILADFIKSKTGAI
jgi:uncharacterized protein (UPF0248 family)